MNISRLLASTSVLISLSASIAYADIAQEPLYTSRQVSPLNMLVMGRDHKLYNEAYNDASDLDGDNLLDVRFKPSVTYYGYFDPNKCYDYSSVDSVTAFVPRTVGAKGNWTDPVDGVSKPVVGLCTTGGAAAGDWSGNFLNYLTTSRIDALRKVLYGGKRSTDSATTNKVTGVTILERSSIPQDAHSWGKEYTSPAVDGYNIADYTPLVNPVAGRRHLFANTTLGASSASSTGDPLLRVLTDAAYRIWEWVSIEQPVAGDKCLNGGSGPLCTASGVDTTHPANSADFASLIQRVSSVPSNAVPNGIDQARNYIYKSQNGIRYVGSTTLNGPGTTTSVDDNNYVSVLKGKLKIGTPGEYTFYANGDDAVEVLIDGVSVAAYFGAHGISGTTCDTAHSGKITLAAGDHDVEFRFEEEAGSDLYNLTWTGPGITGCAYVPYIKAMTGSYGPDRSTVSSTDIPRFVNLKVSSYYRNLPKPVRTDYAVRNQVCVKDLLEDNCTAYRSVSGQTTLLTYKPVGLLQDYGFSASSAIEPKMRFGLLTGSYGKNLSGGVLRRAVGNISDEIDASSGVFSSTVGIIRTIDRLKLVGFNGSEYNESCGRISTRELSSGECRMWGNPIAEMMYEATRYFAGKGKATAAYTYKGGDDEALKLPVATWDDPYNQTGVRSCSTPVQTVISDINPSYDTDELPGSNWPVKDFSSDLTTMDVGKLADTIWNTEFKSASKLVYIGEAAGKKDGAPSAKQANTFRDIRGLAPEEPTKYGGYYAASVAYYGRQTVLNARSTQKMTTFSVALASPLPQLKIPVGGNTVTLVPFAKSVGGNSISADQAKYQPTNAIVDFYVESIAADRTSGTFRVNFEDTEQGADYDMDAIAKYSYKVNSDGTLTVTMSSDYAAGGIIQHMGYVISGTQTDGVYLEVRDADTGQNDDVKYYLDTGTRVNNNIALPLQATRIFKPGTTPGAELLKDPLWYAAKWGGFSDRNASKTPDIRAEWTSAADSVTDPDPDNYFLVTNALGLRAQLDKAFSDILQSLSSSSSAAASTGVFVAGSTQVVQARFRTSDWSGELIGYKLLDSGAIGAVAWNAAEQVPAPSSRNIYTLNPTATGATRGASFRWASLTPAQQTSLKTSTPSNVNDTVGQQRLDYLRGNVSREARNGGTFRNRPNGVLGDIINSNPQYVESKYSELPLVPTDVKGSYATFRRGLSRPETVYAGGNDGMLHAFCAANCGSTVVAGQELFAYVPNFLIGGLYQLTVPDYTHRYFVDGVAKVSDVRMDGTWRTALVGSAGAGGRGLFALDVTSPAEFAEASVLWEFTPANEVAASLSEDLGVTIGSPVITLLKGNSNSVAIFSSGFEGKSGYASLYVLDMKSGALLRRIQLPAAAGANVSAPALLDSDKDGYTDFVYVGDSNGQIWRFDLTAAAAGDWKVDLNNNPLAIAKNASNVVQPISAAPLLSEPDTQGNVMVYFGTGRYLSVTDKSDMTVQAFYGVKDKWLKSTTGFTSVTRSRLVEQTIVTEGAAGDKVGDKVVTFPFRITSANEVDPETGNGYYLTLKSPGSKSERGERIIAPAQFIGQKVVFTTLIPPVDSCEFGGSSWLMELNAVTGKKFDTAILDTNGDGRVDGNDANVNGHGFSELVTGVVAIPGKPSGTTGKIMSGSSGGLIQVENDGNSLPNGRISWRQLE